MCIMHRSIRSRSGPFHHVLFSTSCEANVPLEATSAMFFSDGQCNHEETGTGCCKSETRFWANRFHSIIY